MIQYAFPVDRSAHLRKDEAFIRSLWTRSDARVLVLADGKPVIESNADRSIARIRWLAAAELNGRVSHSAPVFLGIDQQGAGRFAVVTTSTSLAELPDGLRPAVDFRYLVTQGTMTDSDLAIIATALSLAHWQIRARYCGQCGEPTVAADAGWKRICACGAEWFPRVDPVVIMLVTDGERCVLAREPHFPPGLYSTLAGFVEPGEGLQDAVIRETREEVGLLVQNVRLIANQPWPMPHSLMLGCLADVAIGSTMHIDSTEIEDAVWASRDEVRALLQGQNPGGRHVPPRQAIASALLRSWVGS